MRNRTPNVPTAGVAPRVQSGRQSPSSRVPAAARVIQVIKAVANSEDGVGVREVSRETRIDKSAVSRLLRQLTAIRIVGITDSGRYVAGPQLYAIARSLTANDELARIAQPILQRLVHEFNETAYICTIDGDSLVIRRVVESTLPVRFVPSVNQRAPLHSASDGRAVLIGWPPEKTDSYIEKASLIRLTPQTITDRAVLAAVVSADRKRGYTVSVRERTDSAAGIASPVFGADSTCLGSLVLALPADRLTQERAAELGEGVRAAAAELSERLGCSVSPESQAT